MAMIEYKDGNFGEPMNLEDHMQKMMGLAAEEDSFFDLVKATHFGTMEELEEVKVKRPSSSDISVGS